MCEQNNTRNVALRGQKQAERAFCYLIPSMFGLMQLQFQSSQNCWEVMKEMVSYSA